jgi:hypothetical protein
MTSTAMGVDGRLFATVCFGECAEVGNSIRSGYSALFSSTDNGETWARMDFPGESVNVVSLLVSGQPLLRVAQVDSTEASFEIWPSGELFVPPGPGYWPWATQNRQLPVLWENWTTGARVFPDGTTVDIPAQGAAGPDGLPRLVGVQPPRGWIVNWFVREPGFDGYQRLLGADYAGGVRWQFKVPSAVGAIIPVRWLSETRVIAWMNYEAPALIDLDAGTVREIVIGDPLDEFGGRNKPVGIEPRP